MQTSRLNRIEQKKSFLAIGILIGSLIILLGIIFAVYKVYGFYNKIHTDTPTQQHVQKKVKDDYTILLLGYGGGTHEGTYLTDTIMLANINFKTHKVVLVSVPRDLWVKVPTKTEVFHSKVNAVYQMGLFPKTYPDLDTSTLSKDNPSGIIKKVVYDITGLEVDGFFAVDFQGFVKAIDTLDGVDITVDKTFTDYEYPVEGKETDLCGQKEEDLPDLEQRIATESPALVFPCRYETLTFTAGETHMDGETALKYARSRHSLDDGGDFNRAKRQQKVIEAVKDKVLTLNFIPKILPLLDDLGDHIITDIPLSDSNKLLLEGRKSNEYSIKTFVITDEYLKEEYSDNGQYIVVPKIGIDNWSQIKTIIKNIQLGITPTPTKVPVTISPKKVSN